MLDCGRYAARPASGALRAPAVGRVHGLAVYGAQQGAVMDVEAVAVRGQGRVLVTGIVEEEEMGPDGHRLRRKSMARASAENVATLLRRLGYALDGQDLHINFPGGAPVDGPSAGVAMAAAACSALTGRAMDGATALTGEVSVTGEIRAVGGVPAKIEAARLRRADARAGAQGELDGALCRRRHRGDGGGDAGGGAGGDVGVRGAGNAAGGHGRRRNAGGAARGEITPRCGAACGGTPACAPCEAGRLPV